MEILPQLLVNALIAGSIYALVSVGLSLSYGILRILNFAHGQLMMVGAYFFYWASVQQEMSIPVSAAICAVGIAVVGYLTLRIFVLPFSGYSTLLPFVTTLALATMLESIVAMVFDVNVKSLSSPLSIESYEWHEIYITPVQIIIIASALLLLSGLAALIHATSLGRLIRALSENPRAAESLGINKNMVYQTVFLVAMLFAAYSGVMVGYETNLQPSMGGAYTIKAFAAMILGGLGNIWGTIIGSYLLALVENLSIGLSWNEYSLPAGYKDAFAYAIILLVLLFRPQGLFRRAGRTT